MTSCLSTRRRCRLRLPRRIPLILRLRLLLPDQRRLPPIILSVRLIFLAEQLPVTTPRLVCRLPPLGFRATSSHPLTIQRKTVTSQRPPPAVMTQKPAFKRLPLPRHDRLLPHLQPLRQAQ